jgi:hypothetical protein
VLRPGIERAFGVSLARRGLPVDAGIEVEIPEGWIASTCREAAGSHRVSVLAHEVADRNLVTVIARLPDGDRRVSFTLLGPGEQGVQEWSHGGVLLEVRRERGSLHLPPSGQRICPS